MATVAKFYLLDATSPNTGTMPSGNYLQHPHVGTGTDATGFATARDATDVHGSSNPDIDATATAAANQNAQTLQLRRFVSRPLAAHTFDFSVDGNWTFSYARGESNTSHNGQIICTMYAWRPSTGAQVVGVGVHDFSGNNMAATAETADSITGTFGQGAILDGDILVFEIVDSFTQGMSTAYTSFVSYDGTTEANTSTCATFVAPPAALTLYSAPVATVPDVLMAPRIPT